MGQGSSLNSPWKSAAAAVAGRSHIAAGQPCQDCVARSHRNGVSAIVLADGAGSASHSLEGARAVVHTTARLLTTGFPHLCALSGQEAASLIVQTLQERLARLARKLAIPQAQLASTLQFAAVCEGSYIAGILGDGVVGYSDNGHPSVLLAPEKGEFTNQTYFVTSPNAPRHLRLVKGPSAAIGWFCLMSDGTAETFHHRATNTLSSGPARVASWLNDHSEPRVCHFLKTNLADQIRTRTTDDCSLAILARTSS